MRSFFLNFLLALALFGGLFWYLFTKNQQEITSLAPRYGISATSFGEAAPVPAPEGAPTIDTGAK